MKNKREKQIQLQFWLSFLYRVTIDKNLKISFKIKVKNNIAWFIKTVQYFLLCNPSFHLRKQNRNERKNKLLHTAYQKQWKRKK